MAFSRLSFTAFAGAGPYPIHGLDSLSTAHLSVEVDGTPVSATFDDDRKTVTLAASPTAGATIEVIRTTPRKREERLTQFLDLPDGQAGLTAALLDQDYRQNMLVLAEGRDHLVGSAIPEGAMGLDADLRWGGQGLRLKNVTTAAEPGDAATKAQLDTVDAAARPLPTAVLDVDDGLMVVAGEWDDKAPSGFRTALGLGTAATVNVGTGASQIAQFSGDSPPRYPTVDGRNINLSNHALQTELDRRSRATVVYLFTTSGITANNIDPTVGTWSQSASSRVGSLTSPWTNRVELNNSSDVSGTFTPQVFAMSAGTWRIRYVARVRGPAGLFDPWSFRITDNDDTSAQTILYDSGVLRILKQPSSSNISAVYSDEVVLSNASPFSLVFRWAEPNTLSNAMHLRLLFHKVSTSLPS